MHANRPVAASVKIADAVDLDLVRLLFREYSAELGVDLCFQRFEEELAGLPGAYAPPAGRLLVAAGPGGAMGCVAMRPLGAGVCEMKRMYVRPAFRLLGVGRDLAKEIVRSARGAGYSRMRLDTLGNMIPAIRLYESLGFVRTQPYYANPLQDVVYMELAL